MKKDDLIYKKEKGELVKLPPLIYTHITNALKEIEPIGKNKTNQKQGFQYRGIDDVYNSLQPILARHNLFSVPEVLEEKSEERPSKSGGTLIYRILKIKFTMYTIDGSAITGVVIGEGMDSGDKASNKAMAVAHKYFLFQLFAIPTADMADADADSPSPQYEKKKQQTVTNSNQSVTQTKQNVTSASSSKEPIKDVNGDLICPACKSLLSISKYPDKNGNQCYFCRGYKEGCNYKYWPPSA